MLRIDTRGICREYRLKAPTHDLQRWERLFIIRFWPNLPGRPNVQNISAGGEFSGDPPNWDQDPASWHDETGSALVEQASEKAAAYVHAIINRQLSKASGLLSLNSLFFAVFAFVRGIGDPAWSSIDKIVGVLSLLGCSAAIVSVISLVDMLYVGWGTPDDADSHRANLHHSLIVACARTRSITRAIGASFVSIGMATVVILLAIGRHFF